MSYSEFAWKGIARFFKILEKLHYARPIMWDLEKIYLKLNPKKQTLLWIISSTVTVLYGIGIAIFVFAKHVIFTNIIEQGEPFSLLQVVVLLVYFFATVHGFPIFINFLYSGEELVLGFNYLVAMERHITGEFFVC